MFRDRKFVEVLAWRTPHKAYRIAKQIHKEIKTEASSQVCAVLTSLLSNKTPNWVHDLLDHFIDPCVILFGTGGLQLCTVCLPTERCDIFEHFCKNWLPIAMEVQGKGSKKSLLYKELHKKRAPRGRHIGLNLSLDLRMCLTPNFEHHTWEWIQAYLPLARCLGYVIEDVRVAILGMRQTALEKKEKMGANYFVMLDSGSVGSTRSYSRRLAFIKSFSGRKRRMGTLSTRCASRFNVPMYLCSWGGNN